MSEPLNKHMDRVPTRKELDKLFESKKIKFADVAPIAQGRTPDVIHDITESDLKKCYVASKPILDVSSKQNYQVGAVIQYWFQEKPEDEITLVTKAFLFKNLSKKPSEHLN
jgi:hypothetical protein